MKYLDYLKIYDNFDKTIILFDELGFTDEEIMNRLEVSKQLIYNAKRRVEPLLEVLKTIDEEKKDARNKDVQAIIDAFVEQFGVTKTTQYDRWAAKRLYTKHGSENIVAIIKALAHYADDKYCPVIGSVSQIEKKWVNIAKFLKAKSEGSEIMDL